VERYDPTQSMSVHKSEEKLGERARLLEAREGTAPWRQWGPYLSERQWGTVREDYSEHGTAWDYFTHEAVQQSPAVPKCVINKPRKLTSTMSAPQKLRRQE